MDNVSTFIYSIFSLICILFGLATIGCLVLYVISKFKHSEDEKAFECAAFICFVICAVSAFAVIATAPKCNICDASLEVNDKFCRACGVSVETEKPKCPECDTIINANDNFCPECGHATEEVSDEAQ